MDRCYSYLRNIALMMPVCIWMAWPLKYVLGNRIAGNAACALMAALLALGWLPALSRWITAHGRMVLVASILAYVAGLVNVVVFLKRAFCL